MSKKIIVNKKAQCPLCFETKNIKSLDRNTFNLYFCGNCQNGFVFPIPKNLSVYYPEIYWQNQGKFSKFREALHISFQQSSARYFKNYISKGTVLDVASAEGVFGKILGNKFQVTNLEYPGAKIKNENVVKTDFLKWKTDKKFDAIVFLESLEHVTNPSSYLKKAASLLEKDGLIFVEYPRFSSLESKLLGRYWLQRDIPRHLFHFSEQGLRIIARNEGLNVISQKGIMSYQYSPYCLLASIIQIVKLPSLNLRSGVIKNLPTLIFLSVGAPIAFILETLFYLIGESPVGLIVLKK